MMEKTQLTLKIINTIYPEWAGSASFDIDGNIVRWTDTNPRPTQAQIDAIKASLLAEEAANAYKGKRAAEYPPMADYMDAVVKGDVAQQQAYIDACLAVKIKYPKGA